MEFVINVIESTSGIGKDFTPGTLDFRISGCTANVCHMSRTARDPIQKPRMVLCPKWFGRVLMGTTRADGEGTVEKGHPAVHQWNYCVGNSDFTMSVGYKDQNNMENVNHKAGDWSFIPAGAEP